VDRYATVESEEKDGRRFQARLNTVLTGGSAGEASGR